MKTKRPMREKKVCKFYDRTEALKMLYDLEKKGFHTIIEMGFEGLYIYIGGGTHYQESPDIDGDFVSSWEFDKIPDWLKIKEVDYWWLFD